MRRHNRRLFRVTRSVLRDADAAQDAVQETYLRAFTKLDSYQPTRQIRRLAHARGAQRSADDAPAHARRHGVARRSRRRALSVEETAASDAPTADQFVEAAHARALLEHAIDALPENFRMVFMLRAGRRARRARNRGVPRASTPPRCARGCSARSASCAASCRAGCRARARRSSISARSAAIASWHVLARLPHYRGCAVSTRSTLRVPAAHPPQMSGFVSDYSGASSSSGITGERLTVSSTMDEVTSRTPATRNSRRMVKSDSASMSRTMTCNRKSISPVMV